MSKWVLVDLSVLAYKAMYACGDLAHEDIPTGVLYGFFEQLYSICKNLKSNKVLIFTDSKKSYRSKAFPGYKKKRKEQRTPEEQEKINIMYKQINKLKNKILPKLGFPVYRQTGLESDDLIAYAAQELTRRGEHGVIITSDKDLYQCITSYVDWYDPGQELLIDRKAFRNKYEIAPDRWAMVKALAGCTSDTVPGIKGVGEKGAIQYLKGEMPRNKKLVSIMNAQLSGEVNKWLGLVELPHKKTKQFEIREPEYNIKMFFNFAKHFGITTYYEQSRRRTQWIKFFRGEFKGNRKLRRRKKK